MYYVLHTISLILSPPCWNGILRISGPGLAVTRGHTTHHPRTQRGCGSGTRNPPPVSGQRSANAGYLGSWWAFRIQCYSPGNLGPSTFFPGMDYRRWWRDLYGQDDGTGAPHLSPDMLLSRIGGQRGEKKRKRGKREFFGNGGWRGLNSTRQLKSDRHFTPPHQISSIIASTVQYTTDLVYWSTQ